MYRKNAMALNDTMWDTFNDRAEFDKLYDDIGQFKIFNWIKVCVPIIELLIPIGVKFSHYLQFIFETDDMILLLADKDIYKERVQRLLTYLNGLQSYNIGNTY